MVKYTHPDRYVFNYMPGGTRFMRNAPIPLDVRAAAVYIRKPKSYKTKASLAEMIYLLAIMYAQVCFPEGIPDDVEVSPIPAINVDATPLPAKKTVFIDFSKKGYD